MKKTMLLIAAIVLLALPVQAQQLQTGKPGREAHKAKIFERKLAFMKENLMLNKTESERFESSYKKYTEEKVKLKERYRNEVGSKLKMGALSKLSDNEKKAIIKNKLELDKERYELDRNFTVELTKFLPAEKVIRYFKLDREFNRKMMKRLKEHKKHDMDRRRTIKKRRDNIKNR